MALVKSVKDRLDQVKSAMQSGWHLGGNGKLKAKSEKDRVGQGKSVEDLGGDPKIDFKKSLGNQGPEDYKNQSEESARLKSISEGLATFLAGECSGGHCVRLLRFVETVGPLG